MVNTEYFILKINQGFMLYFVANFLPHTICSVLNLYAVLRHPATTGALCMCSGGWAAWCRSCSRPTSQWSRSPYELTDWLKQKCISSATESFRIQCILGTFFQWPEVPKSNMETAVISDIQASHSLSWGMFKTGRLVLFLFKCVFM